MIFLTSLTYTMFFSLLNLKSPLFMSFSLVMLSVLVALQLGSMSSKWFCYILMLLFAGGMMVLFVYASSLANSQKPATSFSLFSATSMSFLFIVLIILTNNGTFVSSIPMMGSLFSLPSTGLVVFLILYLFLILLIVVKLGVKEEGSMKTWLTNDGFSN